MKKIITNICFLSVLASPCFAQQITVGALPSTHKLQVVDAVASTGNAAIYSINKGKTGNAVLGISNNAGTYGVRGSSSTGIGVQGYTSTGTAIVASAISGTAVYAQNSSGYSLVSSGKLKFSGGNTNPSQGAILTGDANGNATWKPSTLAFYASNSPTGVNNSFTKIEFSNENYDTHNSFSNFSGTANANSSVFTAPVAGIYHFSAALLLEKTNEPSNSIFMKSGIINLKKNGLSTCRSAATFITHLNSSGGYSCFLYLNIDADVHLDVNDKVWIEAITDQASNSGNLPVPMNNNSSNCRFNGELLFAD